MRADTRVEPVRGQAERVDRLRRLVALAELGPRSRPPSRRAGAAAPAGGTQRSLVQRAVGLAEQVAQRLPAPAGQIGRGDRRAQRSERAGDARSAPWSGVILQSLSSIWRWTSRLDGLAAARGQSRRLGRSPVGVACDGLLAPRRSSSAGSAIGGRSGQRRQVGHVDVEVDRQVRVVTHVQVAGHLRVATDGLVDERVGQEHLEGLGEVLARPWRSPRAPARGRAGC